MAACSLSSSRDLAVTAVQTFHQNMDARQYEAIIETTSEELLQSVGRQHLLDFLAETRNAYGTLVEQQLLAENVEIHQDTTIVSLQYRTNFSLKIAEEEFLFVIKDDEAKLLQYGIHATAESHGDLQT